MKKYKEWLTNEIEIMESETSENYPHEQMVEREVVLNLINQLDEPEVLSQELPAIPRYVANWLDDNIERYRSVYSFIVSVVENFGDTIPDEVRAYAGENSDTMARAYLDDYTVAEEEPLYRALIKGRHLIYGDDPLKYWNFDPRNNSLFVGTSGYGHGIYINEMSKFEWTKLRINDSNADFVKVEELEK